MLVGTSELSQLSSDGVAYIQIDAPRYSYYLDPTWRSWIRTELESDPDKALDDALRADNCLLAGRPPRRRRLGHPLVPGKQPEPLEC